MAAIRALIWLAGVVALTVGMLTAWLAAVLGILAHDPALPLSGALFAVTGASAIVAGIGVALLRAGLPWRGARTLELGNPYEWANFAYRPIDVAGVLLLAAALPAVVFTACEVAFPTPQRGRVSMWRGAGLSAWFVGTIGVAVFLWWRFRAAKRRRLDAVRAVAANTGGHFEADSSVHHAFRTPLNSFGADRGRHPGQWPWALLEPTVTIVTGSSPCAVTWDHHGQATAVFDYVRYTREHSRREPLVARFAQGEGRATTAAVTAWASGVAFQVAPAGPIRRMLRSVFGSGDAFADQPEFAARFTVNAGDRDAVARLLAPEVRSWLLVDPGWTLESDGGSLVLYRGGLLAAADRFPDQVAKLAEILHLLTRLSPGPRATGFDFPPIWVSGM